MNQHLMHIESKIRDKPKAPQADLETLLRPAAERAPA